MRSKEDLMLKIEEEDVEFIRLQCTDIMGNLKNIAITPNQFEKVSGNMYPFKAAALFDGRYDYPENLYLRPDYDSFVILPWRPQQGKVAKLVCDICTEDGKCFALSSRRILKNVLEKAKAMGYEFMVTPECEFFLFHTDEGGMPTLISHDKAGYMDVGPVDFGENARRDIVLMLEAMDFDIISSHHESAPAQHEIDFSEQEALKCADSIQTFRFAVRSVAKRFGLYATFMPKPKTEESGSGMHTKIVMLKDGKNVFRGDNGEISETAIHFIGGLLHHANALCAVSNPIVNSYKRLINGFDAPGNVCWTMKSKRAMVNMHKSFGDIQVELRTPDGAANPYLLIAGMIAAGLDGVEKGMEAGEECLGGAEQTYPRLPGSLKTAINAFAKDSCFKEAFGEEFVKIYYEIKNAEWEDYMKSVSEWEIDRYLTRM